MDIGGIEMIVNWRLAFYQTAGVNAPPPVWNPATSTLSGSIPIDTAPSTLNNFAFLTTDVQLDSILMEITTESGDGVAFAVSRQQVPQCTCGDIDANGVSDALTDGVLILRFMFGFRGPALTQGAVAPDCAICSDTSIEACLARHYSR